jgi:hypothetical protein
LHEPEIVSQNHGGGRSPRCESRLRGRRDQGRPVASRDSPRSHAPATSQHVPRRARSTRGVHHSVPLAADHCDVIIRRWLQASVPNFQAPTISELWSGFDSGIVASSLVPRRGLD